MRNEDYDRELLVAVTLICVALTTVAGAFETTTAPPVIKAGAQASQRQASQRQASQRIEQLAPVRIVGTPFVPNTNPGAR